MIEKELGLLYDLGQAKDLGNLEAMVNGVYFSTYLKNLGFLRKKLKWRLSGTRIIRTARKYFETSQP